MATKKVGVYGSFAVGDAVLIRTVTMIQTGRIVAAGTDWIELSDAAWIADTGRFSEALKSGTLNEVEPYSKGRCVVGRGAIVDVADWTHDLPRAVK